MRSRHAVFHHDVIRNRDAVPRDLATEADSAAQRAIAAGARTPLVYVGAGMTGIVFCDRYKNLAYKVARSAYSRGSLAEETEWLRAAAKDPEIRRHVASGARWDAKHGVLIRRCARGRSGTWGESSKLRDLHEAIERRMLPRGWTAPEFKEDSYVLPGDYGRGDFSRAVLVDASMPHRVGKVLLRYAEEVARGRRELGPGVSDINDVAYFVHREVRTERNPDGTIEPAAAERVFKLLREAGATRWVP